MNCPLKIENPDCSTCPFSKEGICDYPWIADEEGEVHSEQ